MKAHAITPETLQMSFLRKSQGHKFSYGHALVISGGIGRTGAARLAARGALRIGAGLVTIGVPPPALPEVAAQITAIMMREVGGQHALAEILRDDRITALCMGPGLGLSPVQADMVGVALRSERALVLDADALSLIAQQRSLFVRLHRGCVITPHAGEFARLFPDISERLAADPPVSKASAAAEAADRAGCTVLLKGEETVVAQPGGQVGIHRASGDRAAPWLATAGSGDVLAGFITGLMARGFSPFKAAELATFLHVEAALRFGPGLIAEDLPEQLPMIFRALVS